MILKPLIFISMLTVFHPSQSPVESHKVFDKGLIYCEWTLAKKPSVPARPNPIFNHFIKSQDAGWVTFRTHYYGYTGPSSIELLLGWQKVLRSKPLPFWERGKPYHLCAFWRPAGPGKLECGIYVNWDLVAHAVVPTPRFIGNPVPLRVASEKVSTKIDPSFPAVHWIDGSVKNFLYATW